MSEDETHIGKLLKCAVHEQTDNCSCRVKVILEPPFRNLGNEFHAASRSSWVDKHDRLPTIQFLKSGRVGGSTGPLVVVVGHERDAVGLQHIVRVFDLLQASILVGQW